ncbi:MULTISPECIES: spore germination protein [unclassified Bacillus (in: firmicutes)]|uniref:spore germination protein n=1 Tax=unclassified Bacillus (in: firmicutes) TaxID=185979 RepID=UPI0008ED2382|nr:MULTISPECIES: spore germination protein [unclassified Bacillus (in: firmicutes)]SFA79484.1 spore germination protein PF [Bacillus sp. UNCCL13]SFQ69510.1 spore germination protein PF [Bacillus sp. cl95]
MPAIVGPVQIVNVGGGTVQFGDTVIISPKSASKANSGSGSGNTGGFIITNNGISASNVLDTNLVDQPITGNN